MRWPGCRGHVPETGFCGWGQGFACAATRLRPRRTSDSARTGPYFKRLANPRRRKSPAAPPPRYQAATVPVPVRASTPTDRLRIRPHARRAPTVRLRLGHHPCKAGHPWHPGRGHGLRALTVPQGFPAPGQPSARLDLRVVNHLVPLYLVGRTGAKAAGNRAPDARAESPPAARKTHAASHH